MMTYRPVMASEQKGVALLEAMIALLVFSFGILGLVGMQALAIKSTSDAKFRADASFLANQIIAEMWAAIPRDSLAAANQAVLAGFAHHPAGAVCGPSGAATGNGTATAWLAEVNRVLPNAAASRQQIVVDAATGQVTVSICWSAVQEAVDHNHTVTARVVKN